MAGEKSFQYGDIVEMKKPHPCGANAWTIIRMGMDIRIKCTRCGRSVLLPRSKFERSLKRVLQRADSAPPVGEGASSAPRDSN
ncbi:MAG: DUF951 domain-containing protein [Alicyclobacillaceae bacterium]|nr:DUF951 domain-containing protein [Alicyclobacillaceae bacterium]